MQSKPMAAAELFDQLCDLYFDENELLEAVARLDLPDLLAVYRHGSDLLRDTPLTSGKWLHRTYTLGFIDRHLLNRAKPLELENFTRAMIIAILVGAVSSNLDKNRWEFKSTDVSEKHARVAELFGAMFDDDSGFYIMPINERSVTKIGSRSIDWRYRDRR